MKVLNNRNYSYQSTCGRFQNTIDNEPRAKNAGQSNDQHLFAITIQSLESIVKRHYNAYQGHSGHDQAWDRAVMV